MTDERDPATPSRLGVVSLTRVEREPADGRRPTGPTGPSGPTGAQKATRYEDAMAVLCSGVFFVAAAAFVAYSAPDLGEPLARSGLPLWAFVGLLALAGTAMAIGGAVALVVGRLSRRKTARTRARGHGQG